MNGDKRIWFKAKLYGWGWTPATWQGWLAMVVYIVVIEASTLGLLWRHVSTGRVIAAIAVGVAATVGLGILCYRRGDPPRWRWGPDK